MASKHDYDVIIIGGGPNGETLASYLLKAGAKCLIVERRDEMGGGLITEDLGGFRFNFHATYMMLAELLPPYHDLKLIQYGCKFIRPEVQFSLLYSPNKSLTFYLDPQKTAASISKLSPDDGPKFLKLYEQFKEACDECLIPATYVPPAPPAEYAAMLSETELGTRVLEWSEMSAQEVLESFEIKDERVKAAILYLGCMWGVDPSLTGLGFMFPIFVFRMLNGALVHGGSHRLSSSLLRSAYENGLEVKEDTIVSKIIVEDGAAKGVVTEEGEKIRSRAVVSTVNPHQTFLEFAEEQNLDPVFAETIRDWKWEDWSLFSVHLGIKGRPKFRAAADSPDCDRSLLQVIGYEDSSQVQNHWNECIAGKLPGPEFGVTPTSFHDSTQAPDGYEVIRMETQVPFEAEDGDWEGLKNEYAESILSRWREYLSNANDIKIVHKLVYPPTYIQMKLINMVRGSIKQGSYIPTQMGYFRPNADCSHYSTPIPGLYIAGAAAYPGGMITLGPGYTAAGVIARDLNLDVWWKEPEYVSAAREKKLVP